MERENKKFIYRVYLKSGEVVDVEGVSFVSDYETEIRLNDEEYNPVCVVSKSQYEYILKVGSTDEKVVNGVESIK